MQKTKGCNGEERKTIYKKYIFQLRNRKRFFRESCEMANKEILHLATLTVR